MARPIDQASPPARQRRIGIAGAGLLGRLLAWRLSGLGHAVTVFDPAPDAQARGAAGWTAAGMLSPWAELECSNADLAELGLRSIALWRRIVPQLPGEVELRCDGSLLLAHRSDLGSAQRLVGLLEARGPAALRSRLRRLELGELQLLEPAVHGPTHAWLLDGEAQIHSVQAMRALADGATQRGTRWRWGSAVAHVAPGRLDDERFDLVFDVRGVGARPSITPSGEDHGFTPPIRGESHGFTPEIRGDDLGFTPRLRGDDLGFTPRLRGVRGEILWLHAPGVVLNRPLRLLHPRWRVYLVPRAGELIVVGASEIESEDRSPISVRTMLGLLAAAHSVIPELAEARIVHSETNLRPALPDNLPRVEQLDGLVRINGLFRHGWLIAPALVEDALGGLGVAVDEADRNRELSST